MLRAVLILVLSFVGLLSVSVITPASASSADQVTTTRSLQRGTIIREGDVIGPFVEEDYLGRELVRSVRAGAVMSPHHVRTPLQVKRNETVTLVFRKGPLTMETVGRSLGEGANGDRISVINTSSRKRVIGRIVGEGLVEVTP
ncbi:MAG: flagellar basal body P-ring formation chaperone FlgA [Pseudomonadota bacterium]